MWIQIIGHLLAGCIGLSLGLLGGGGSVLALPILVYVMGIPAKSAIPMTLVIVGTVSLIGTIPHWRKGNVNLQKAGIFGSATMLGAFLGAKLANLSFITETVQLLLFAAIMLIAAMLMIRKGSSFPKKEETNQYPPPACKYCWLWLPTEGLGIGILTGLVGVGGGFAIVPALVLLGKTPIKEAIGTSLLIITLNSVAGFLGYLGTVSLNWGLMATFTCVAAVGTFVGAYLSQYIQAQQLQKGFGYFLIAVATFIFIQR
ncbi:MAG: sulfite exporter TauE/SafE family protein [Crocosphaera sp.]|nr:sulfite exporter TauE/SafE family protein [Crocosphaera sp.]